jgi:hypothetical protein
MKVKRRLAADRAGILAIYVRSRAGGPASELGVSRKTGRRLGRIECYLHPVPGELGGGRAARRATMGSDDKMPKRGLGWIWWAIVLPLVVTVLGGLAVEYLKPDKSKSESTESADGKGKPQAQPTRTAGKVLYGPIKGQLHHEAGAKLVTLQRAGVSVRDCVVEATFFNPYDAGHGSWTLSLQFRSAPGSVSGQYRVGVCSDGSWYYGHFDEHPQYVHQGGGPLPSGALAANKAMKNSLRLVLNGIQGQFFLNGHFVADLDVPGSSGDVAVEIDLRGYGENVDVEFEEFRIAELK